MQMKIMSNEQLVVSYPGGLVSWCIKVWKR